MADIVLINPAYMEKSKLEERYQKYLKWIQGGNMYIHPFEPPIGLAYLVSYCRSRGIDVKIIDVQGNRLELDDVKTQLQKYNPSMVGVTAMTTTMPSAMQMVQLAKETLPNARIVMGGVHPTISPEEVLDDSNVDFVIRGEGEFVLSTLFEQLQKGEPLNAPGLVYKEEDKKHFCASQQLIKDLDVLPSADYESFPAEEYIRYNQELRSLKGISMIVTRGCPYGCTFCAVEVTMGKRYRLRSPAVTVDEMLHLRERFGIEGIWFKDSIFNLNKRWVYEFCDILIKRGVNMNWQCNTRVDLIDEEMIKAMKRAGLTQIDVGIESGSPETLETLGKRMLIGKIEKAVELAKKYVKVSGFFMVGVPGETMEDVEATFEMAKRLKIDKSSWSIFTPLPGTDLYDDLVKSGELNGNVDFQDIHFTDTRRSFSKIPADQLNAKFQEINNYFCG